ncbi:MAG: hypothetical protein ABI594_13490 [Ginsengibacter sp.]
MSNGANKIKTESETIKNYLWGSVIIAIILGVIMIGLISSYAANHYISAFGCGILIAGASISSGGVLGFIFGIPSVSQTPNARLKYNDNLVQISDWLTKIIVGVGLTQLYNIPRFVIKIGGQFQINFGGGTWAVNVAIAIMSYFFVLGFLMIYFWTKTDYSTIMKNMDIDLNRQLEDETKAKEHAQQERKDMATEIIQKETKTRISESDIASDKNTMAELQQNVNDSLSGELDKLKTIVSQKLSSKPVTIPDDLQKGRWGGKSENNGKKINAKVTKNSWQNLFDLVITIYNIDNTPLIIPVAIFVHDSYNLPDNVVYVAPDKNKGVAELSILAYEAFTIGALFADGTELELDLNEQQGFPTDFYW